MPLSRTRIEFVENLGNDAQVYFRLYEPTDVPDARKQERINCDVDQPPFADLAALAPGAPPAGAPLVRDVGESLYGRLAAHPGVAAVLQRVVAAGPGDYCPVYLEITGEAAEALPFETLFVPGHHFLALDERTPIVRVATARGNATDVTERLYDPPLRIAAVISAAGRDRYEDKEWSSLRSAIADSPVPVKLQVFVGRRPLYDAIVGENDGRFAVEMIPDEVDTLVDRIKRFAPSILHLFCHGVTDPAPYLQVATPRTHDNGEEPLYIGQTDLEGLADSLWLVTLNACDGAGPIKDAHSMALALANRGVPAVVGMREAIDASHANTFANAFYEAMLAELDRVLQPGAVDALDWACLLRKPRARLRAQAQGTPHESAERSKAWSLPVLYVRPGDFRLQRPAPSGHDDSPEDRRVRYSELRMLVETRARLHPDTPAAMLAEIDARIAKLEASLLA